MLDALAHPIYRRLYLAQVVALLGSGLATVALGLMAYNLAGDRAAQVLGTALAVKMVAYVTIAPVMEALVHRIPRKKVLIAADLTRMVIAACLPLVTETWQIYPLIFLLQASSATFTPLFQSVVPDVLTDEDAYTGALSLSRLAHDVESIASPMVAALLLLFIPATALFDGTAMGFAGSALLVFSCAIPQRNPTNQETDTDQLSFPRRVRAGTTMMLTHPKLRPILALNMAPAAGGAFVIVQTVVIAQSRLGLGEEAVAWLLAAAGLGSIAAAFALPPLLRKVPDMPVMLCGAACVTVAVAAIVPTLLVSSVAIAVTMIAVLWALVGLGWAAAETPVGRILRRHVPSADLPAVFAAQFSLSHACWLVTYPLVGWLGTYSMSLAAVVMAVLAGVGGIVAAILWRSALPAGGQ
ncbi:MFS transporter [Corynebacterium sp. TAE3-ERU12]|uniref:MFS transporter n=1 Tax=Corynebacterium sp. TAE3-ERU12 TaxID=2849491 RepID=UPI001C478620|nr:MFS transporter [Corynebacterium sp. TAE3-ERU12]MBV7295986.1 MFS transporter [Corynebacterium sp. TAE3-ERU12]